jgi:hypothetical protein
MMPWLFAAAAVAYVLLTRQQAPAALPPLVPAIAAPSLPPLSAPAASGPHPLYLLAILGAGAMVAWAIHSRPTPQPAPGPTPPPAVALDLRGKFVGTEAAGAAATTAALLGELSQALEYDGTQTEPRLKTGAAFDDLRRAARELRTRGVSLGARQPAVRDAIKAFLDSEVGTDGGPVDAAARAKWVRAFRDIATAAEAAIR